MSKAWGFFADIIIASIKTPAGILSLLILLAAFIGLSFFRKGPYQAQLLVFGCFVVGGVGYGWSIHGIVPSVIPDDSATKHDNEIVPPGPTPPPTPPPSPTPAPSNRQHDQRSSQVARNGGCKPVIDGNAEFQITQDFPIDGGECGGRAKLSVKLSGQIQSGKTENQKVVLDVLNQSGEMLCHKFDNTFTSEFNLNCKVSALVAKNSNNSFKIIVETNNVSDHPSPKMTSRFEFLPN